MIVKRFKETREYMELTQKDLAIYFNVHSSTISGWEIGKDTIPLKHLINYANKYNYSLEYLFGLTDKNNYKKMETNKKKIGNNLKKLRKNNNFTLEQIANKLNCDISTYDYYELGKNLISTTFLFALKDIYKNVSLDDIFVINL